MGKKKKYYKKPEVREELPDTPERRAQLIKSYEGQIAYCYKRIAKAQKKINSNKKHRWWTTAEMLELESHFYTNILEWQRRIDICKNGGPLDFLGTKLTKGKNKGESFKDEG